jgi:hypothetical protein
MKYSEKQKMKKLRSEIYWLKKELEQQCQFKYESQDLVRRHREYLDHKFNWFVELIEGSKTPNLPWLVKDIKDFLVRTAK